MPRIVPIPWKSIGTIPPDRKDGRLLLLREKDGTGYLSEWRKATAPDQLDGWVQWEKDRRLDPAEWADL